MGYDKFSGGRILHNPPHVPSNYNIWPAFDILPGDHVVLSQTGPDLPSPNFDTSDFSVTGAG